MKLFTGLIGIRKMFLRVLKGNRAHWTFVLTYTGLKIAHLMPLVLVFFFAFTASDEFGLKSIKKQLNGNANSLYYVLPQFIVR